MLSVTFGQDSTSTSLRRMVKIALDAQNNALQGRLIPAAATGPSMHMEVLDAARRQFILGD